MIPRMMSAARYMSFADSPTRWRLAGGRCPNCGPTLFVSLRASGFLTRCVRCRANAVTLAPISVLQGMNLSGTAYELSTFGVLLHWLRKRFQVVTSEYFPGHQSGELVGGILCQNVQALSFPDESFDLVTSNSVFEHVNDDLRGFAEIRRVLKPWGAMVLTVPLYDLPATQRLSRYRDDGSLEWLGTPEYHDSRMGGPKSAPVVWLHSRRDIVARVKSAGFSRVELVDVVIAPIQRTPDAVICAHR